MTMEPQANKGVTDLPGKEFSVLFVEDEPIITMSFVKVLKRRFAQVYAAKDGEMGLELFKQHRPDIVFTDILMPRMNGIEMTRQIKELSADTPIIVMTAVNEEPYREKARALGAFGYLTKPIDEEEFFSLLKRTTETLRQRKETVLE